LTSDLPEEDRYVASLGEGCPWCLPFFDSFSATDLDCEAFEERKPMVDEGRA